MIFFSIAFGGLVVPADIADIILTSYAIKVVLMMLTAPLLYLNSVGEDSGGGTAMITVRHHANAAM